MGYSVISKVQNTYPGIQESVDGLTFIQKVAEFYDVIDNVNNSKAGLLFMQSIALGLDITWSLLVEYIYCLVKEKNPSLYKDYEYTLDYQDVCLNIGGVFGKLLGTKADSVFANKYLFDAVVANTGVVAEEWLQEFILEKYGWHNVMRDMAIMYNGYLVEQAQIAEKEDRDYIKRTIEAINKGANKATKKKEKVVISVAIADALTEEEYSTLYNWICEDEKIAHKLHLKAVDGKVYSDKEEVKVDAPVVEAKEPLEDETPLAEEVIESIDEVEETKATSVSTISVTSKEVITKKDVKAMASRGKAVIAHCLDDDTTQRFNNVAEASEALHISMIDIRKNLKGHTKQTGKGKEVKHYVFSYETPKLDKGKVLQIDPMTKTVVAEFNKVRDAEREYGFKPTKLNGVLKTVNKLCDGYMWMYESEYKEKFPSMKYGKVA